MAKRVENFEEVLDATLTILATIGAPGAALDWLESQSYRLGRSVCHHLPYHYNGRQLREAIEKTRAVQRELLRKHQERRRII